MLWNSERTGLLYTDLICHSAKRQCNDRCGGGGGGGCIPYTQKHRMYLSGMLKQKTYHRCCFTINQVLNKPNKDNGCNSENFMAYFKCLRSKFVGNVYAVVIFMCWYVRNGVEPNAPFRFVSCMLSLYFIITKDILNALS
jgi:hypothetical protein